MTTASEPSAAELGIRKRPLDLLCADTLRMLSVDMVNAANCGHPGLPMGAADMAYVLWTRFLRFDPDRPEWRDRDRFVLSAGHGSALLYALLHVSGYDLPMEELRNFRQIHSRTPGHPERGLTQGVEVTTGPLGQGIANAVGIALGGRMLAARFGAEVCSHRTFVLAGDGDMMEGVASEACSLAGHWGLGNLVVLYDSNRISIDGSTDIAFTEDVGARFRAYGWHVTGCDGHDHDAVAAGIDEALAVTDRPSLVICRTTIGKGSPNRAGTADAHGMALGAEETVLTKEAYGWPQEPAFVVPREVRERFAARADEGRAARAQWGEAVSAWRRAQPEVAGLWESYWNRPDKGAAELLREVLDAGIPKDDATRKHSASVLQVLAEKIPNLVGGSADLTGSNLTLVKGSPAVGDRTGKAPGEALGDPDFVGRNLYFGVREHAMGAILNGLDAQGAFIPYAGTFLAFLDYMRPPVRLAALSGHGSVFVMTHDSIGLGEDGPTHQPVEHVWSARIMPGVTVHRPADFMETAAAWCQAVENRDGPSVLVLTRQKVPNLARPAGFEPAHLLRGAYVACEAGSGTPSLVLIATGSEVEIALGARTRLEAEGIATRVVSMPCIEVFDRQDQGWKDSVLPPGVRRISVEAGRTDGWYRFVGSDGLAIGVDGFGLSAPYKQAYEHFGLTPDAVADRVLAWLAV